MDQNLDELLKQTPTLTLNPEDELKPQPEAAAEPAAATTATAAPASEGITLTMGNAVNEPAVAPAPSEAMKPVDDSMLSDSEKKQVNEFVKQIDITNTSAVIQYGSGAQQKMAQFSDKALASVRTKDLGETGELLTGVVAELKNFNADDEKGGIFGFFKKQTNKLEVLKTRYDKAEVNVNKICDALQDHQVTLMKDSAMLDQMYQLNLVYFKELTMYIIAGQKKLNEVRSTTLVELNNKAARTGAAEDLQAAKDCKEMCDRFEKKIYDLELTRTVAMQTAPQIRLIQQNDVLMSDKIQSTLVNTIPLWKSQMTLALGIEHANQAAKAERAVNDMTNELLKQNAEKLKVASVNAAKESERGIVDIETLTQTNQTLISTFDEVMQIQKDGHEKRVQAEAEMTRLESELKNKLLEVSRG
jgi:uncharacterized protein YaaN involved in tellurite resistance